MGQTASSAITFPDLTAGRVRICVSGFKISHHTGRARQIADLIAKTYPDQYETWFAFTSNDEYRGEGPDSLLKKARAGMPEDNPLQQHRTSPYCWLEMGQAVDGKTYPHPSRGVHIWALGGRDRLCEWVQTTFPESPENAAIRALATDPSIFDAWVDETPGTSQ